MNRIEFGDEADIAIVARARRRQEVHDLRVACRLLFFYGATEEEVDDILSDRPIPIDPDDEWARMELSRHTRLREGR